MDLQRISGMEVAVLAVLALLVVVGGWMLFQKMSGRTRSDVSGLRLGGQRDAHRES
ncbi:MAG TPA: hypothetical protein VEX86_24235 [Longimicrobium sp.]|nr:hypothetical protein [Longimicrobium sp.]